MVEITLLELNVPDARATAEAEFNAPFAGRGRSSAEDDGNDSAAESVASGGPSPESVVALLVGLLSVAALVWLRTRGGTEDETSDTDD